MKSQVLSLTPSLILGLFLKPSGHAGSVLNEYNEYLRFNLLLWRS